MPYAHHCDCLKPMEMSDKEKGDSGLARTGVFAGLFVAFVFLLKPDIWSSLAYWGLEVPWPDRVWMVALAIVSAVSLILFFAARKPDFFFVALALCMLWIVLATVLNGGSLKRLWYDWVPLFATVCLVGAFARKHIIELLRAMYWACMLYLLVNALGIIVAGSFGFESQKYLFFGVRTLTFRVAIPAIVCSFLLDAESRRNVSFGSVSACLIAAIELCIGYSATSLVAIGCLVTLRLAFAFPQVRERANALTLSIASLASCFGVVVLRIQNAFGWLVESILHRNLSLTGRTGIWDAVFALLGNSHIMYGYGASYIWSAITVNGRLYMHAHDDILNILMTGGIVLLGLIAVLFFLSIKCLYRYKETLECSLIVAGLFCFMIIGIFEVSFCVGYFYLLAMAYYASDHLGRRSERECVNAK